MLFVLGLECPPQAVSRDTTNATNTPANDANFIDICSP